MGVGGGNLEIPSYSKRGCRTHAELEKATETDDVKRAHEHTDMGIFRGKGSPESFQASIFGNPSDWSMTNHAHLDSRTHIDAHAPRSVRVKAAASPRSGRPFFDHQSSLEMISGRCVHVSAGPGEWKRTLLS